MSSDVRQINCLKLTFIYKSSTPVTGAISVISFPPIYEAHDILHLGILFRRIRATRGLSQSDIAQALAVTNSTISKFESTGRSRRAQIIERYIRILQSPSLNGNPVPCPLY